MTYQQSLENIEAILNFIRMYDKTCIFFDYYSQTNFKILFFDQKEDVKKIEEMMSFKISQNRPFAHIILEHEMERLFYYDENIDYKINLVTLEVIHNDSNHDFIKQDPMEIKLQAARLLAKLKQM